MEDVDKVGGMGAILKSVYKKNKGNLDLTAKTVYGSLGSYVKNSPDPDGKILKTASDPFSNSLTFFSKSS